MMQHPRSMRSEEPNLTAGLQFVVSAGEEINAMHSDSGGNVCQSPNKPDPLRGTLATLQRCLQHLVALHLSQL